MGHVFRVIVIVSIIAAAQPALADTSAGLVAHYPLDGNADDTSGNGNDGTTHGGVHYVPGIDGQAALFDGQDDFISSSGDGPLALTVWTLSAWLNPHTTTTSQALIVGKLNDSSGYINYGLSYVSPSVVRSRYESRQTGETDYEVRSSELPLNTWTHVAATRDSAGNHRIYVNGSLYTSELHVPEPAAGSATLVMGKWVSGTVSLFFDGAIDDVRIYNRSLSAADVMELFDGDTAPAAAFSWSPQSPVEDEQVSFTDMSSGSPISWSWNFGDGSTSSQQDPIHIFQDAGAFQVRLTASNAQGSDSITKTVAVVQGGSPPEADFSWAPTSPLAGDSVQFSDQSSDSPDNWSWNFGDGGSSSQPNPSHVFQDAGSYQVTLSVSNQYGSDSAIKTITISANAPPPEADFSWTPDPPEVGQTVQFTDQSTGSLVSWSWGFGDGETSSEQNPSHSYPTSGSHTVSLQVEDELGRTSTRTKPLQVSPDASSGDLHVFGIEVTQAIQDLRNSVVLIDGKQTFVRVHVDSQSLDQQPLSGYLSVRSESGTELGPPLYANNGCGYLEDHPPGTVEECGKIILQSSPERAKLNQSFLFELPREWSSGTIEIEFYSPEISRADLRCDEPTTPAGSAGDCKVTVEFEVAPTAEIRIVPIAWGLTNPTAPTTELMHSAAGEVHSLLPVANVDWTVTGQLRYYLGQPSNEVEFLALLGEVAAFRLLDCIDQPCPTAIHLGLLADPPASGGTIGIGVRLLDVAVAYHEDLGDPNETGHVFANVSHELGHVLGRKHVKHLGNEADWDEWYPFSNGEISEANQGPNAYYGFDIRIPKAHWENDLLLDILGPTRPDLMSYGWYSWPSSYTYEGMLSGLWQRYGGLLGSNQTTGKHRSAPESHDVLVLHGSVNSTMTAAEIQAVVVSAASSIPPNPPGDSLALKFLNSSNTVLGEVDFDPIVASQGDAFPFAVSALMPSDTTRVEISSGTTVLATKSASTLPPEVTVISPNGGEVVSGDNTLLSWSASDGNGDDLFFVIQFSSDNGATWKTITTVENQTDLEISTSSLGGTSAGRIRVLASDGFHTTSDQSNGAFTVPNHSPVVNLVHPAENSEFTGDMTIQFEGSSYDVEDGVLIGSALVWVSDIDGVLGQGRSVSVNAFELSPGHHEITLNATDSSGASSMSQASITLVRRVDSASSHSFLVPAAAHAGGLEDTVWVSDLVLFNPGDREVGANLYFLNRGGANLGADAANLRVPPGKSLPLDDIVLETFGENSAAGGISIAANGRLIVSSRTYNNADNGTFGQYVPGIPISQALKSGDRHRLVQLTKNNDFRSNIGFVSTSKDPIRVNLDLLRANGQHLSTESVNLPPFGYLQLTDVFPVNANDAYAEIYSNTPAATFLSYASVVDMHTGDPVLILPTEHITETGTSVYVAAVAHVSGAAGTNWRTDLGVHNPGRTAAQFRIDLLKKDQANPSPISETLQIGPGKSARYEDVLQSVFDFNGAGSLRITPLSGVVSITSRTFNLSTAGTYGQFIAGVTSESFINSGEIGHLVQLSRSSLSSTGHRSNIGFVNTSNRRIDVKVELYKGDGEHLGTKNYPLQPLEYDQVNDILGKVTTESVENGFAVVSTTTSGGQFIAYASVVDNRSGDPVYIPAAISGVAQ